MDRATEQWALRTHMLEKPFYTRLHHTPASSVSINPRLTATVSMLHALVGEANLCKTEHHDGVSGTRSRAHSFVITRRVSTMKVFCFV